MRVLIAVCSSSAHRLLVLTCGSALRATLACCCQAGTDNSQCDGLRPTYALSALRSSGPGTLSARGNARRRSARSRQAGSGCRCAARPGSRPWWSGTQVPSIITTRNRSDLAARTRHPTHVRTGVARPVTGQSTPSGWAQRSAGPSCCTGVAAIHPPLYMVERSS
jgi:hypothetical protein